MICIGMENNRKQRKNFTGPSTLNTDVTLVQSLNSPLSALYRGLTEEKEGRVQGNG